MVYRPIALPEEPEQPINETRFVLSGGLNILDLPQKLPDNQSNDLLNVWFADKILSKRYGQSYIWNSDYIESPVHKIHQRLYKDKVVVHAGTKLYAMDIDDFTATLDTWASAEWTTAHWGNLVEIYSGLTSQKGSFFVIYDKLYYINGAQWVVYDGNTCTTITPYIPNVLTATTPAGAGTADEDYNRVGAGFSVQYNGNGSATTYYLPQTELDATDVTVIIAGVAKTEGTHFTVNRTLGTVNFAAGTSPHGAPASGTNNVKITAYKTNATERDSVLGCKYAIEYGDNKNVVFLCGNGTGEVYWSETGLPTYIRSSNTNTLGDTNENCNGFGIQYDTLCIFKARTIFSATQITAYTTLAEFAFKIVNDTVGCDMPYTIQLINNRLVWANTYGGVYTLTSTLEKDEKNVKPLSRNINGNPSRTGLLQETQSNKLAATSCDYSSKSQYWLCVGSTVYMWDYGLTPYNDSGDLDGEQQRLSWWKFDTINSNCFFENQGVLYYGPRNKGNIVKLTSSFSDFGSAIDAYYTIPYRDFGSTSWLKTIKTLTITPRSDTFSEINIDYLTESTRTDSQPITVGSFSWDLFSWATFTWAVSRLGKSYTRYPNSKHKLYWGVKFYNNEVGRDLSIIDVVCTWIFSKKIK